MRQIVSTDGEHLCVAFRVQYKEGSSEVETFEQTPKWGGWELWGESIPGKQNGKRQGAEVGQASGQMVGAPWMSTSVVREVRQEASRGQVRRGSGRSLSCILRVMGATGLRWSYLCFQEITVAMGLRINVERSGREARRTCGIFLIWETKNRVDLSDIR